MADEPKPEHPKKELPYYLQEIRDRHREPEFPKWVWRDFESRPNRYPMTRVQRVALILVAGAMLFFVVFMASASPGTFWSRFFTLALPFSLAWLLVYSMWRSLNRR